MTRRLDEAFKIYDAAKETGLHVQVGSQGCSDPEVPPRARSDREGGASASCCGRRGATAATIPRGSGTIRSIRRRRPRRSTGRPGSARRRNATGAPERFFRWRKYWDYGTGIIGDLWPHRLHPLMLAMNLNEFPKSVSCIGADMCHADARPGPDGQPFGERRDVPDTTIMMVEFPSGVSIVLAGSTVNERGLEDVIRGTKANLTMGGNRLQVAPERPFVDQIDARDETPADAGETHVKHMRNFLESLRADVAPNCSEDLGDPRADRRLDGGGGVPQGTAGPLRRAQARDRRVIAAVAGDREVGPDVRLAIDAMATRFELVLPLDAAGDGPRLRAAGEEALAEIVRLESRLSAFRPASDISWINALRVGARGRVEPTLFALLQRCLALSAATDGRVRHHRRAPDARLEGRERASHRRALGARRVGYQHVHLDRVAVDDPVRAVRDEHRPRRGGEGLRHRRGDRDSDRVHGCTSALLHGGTSSVHAIGRAPGGGAWKIAWLRRRGAAGVFGLDGSALSVSAAHGRTFRRDGRDYGHVIDPSTGWPSEAANAAVVTGPRSLECDALSTALLVRGPGVAADAAGALSRLRRYRRLTPQRVHERVHVQPVRVERSAVDEERRRLDCAGAPRPLGLSQHAGSLRA